MDEFKGKTLLVLGGANGAIDIVRYAKSKGTYVIVTDYLPTEKSEAKPYADEIADISTIDVDRITQFSRERKIDGIFCGISETSLQTVCAVASKLDLPCFLTREQYDLVHNKVQFHELCRRFHIPTPHRYSLDAELGANRLPSVQYPVIVKPVDNNSGRGINICHAQEELAAACQYARKYSASREIVVEQYLTGSQFSAVYVIMGGECRLSMMGDWQLNCTLPGSLPQLEACMYPSRYLPAYLETLHPRIVKLVRSLRMECGAFFVQGITDGKTFTVFEGGLRLPGHLPSTIAGKVNGSDMLHVMTDYALTGNVQKELLAMEDPFLHGKRACLLAPNCRNGTIAKIRGMDILPEIKGVIDAHLCYQEGDIIQGQGTMKQIVLWSHILRDTPEELRHAVRQAQQCISVLDTDGNSLLLPGVNPEAFIYALESSQEHVESVVA